MDLHPPSDWLLASEPAANQILTLTLDGEWEADALKDLGRVLERLIHSGWWELVIDLRKVRHLDYRSERIASIEARFVRPVFPGDTLRTEIWQDGNRISFQSSVPGREGYVLTNGLAVLRG